MRHYKISHHKRDQVILRDGRQCALCGCETILQEEFLDHFVPDPQSPGIMTLCNPTLQREYERRRFTLDHVIPRVKGGTNTIENLRVLCNPCNARKGPK